MPSLRKRVPNRLVLVVLPEADRARRSRRSSPALDRAHPQGRHARDGRVEDDERDVAVAERSFPRGGRRPSRSRWGPRPGRWTAPRRRGSVATGWSSPKSAPLVELPLSSHAICAAAVVVSALTQWRAVSTTFGPISVPEQRVKVVPVADLDGHDRRVLRRVVVDDAAVDGRARSSRCPRRARGPPRRRRRGAGRRRPRGQAIQAAGSCESKGHRVFAALGTGASVCAVTWMQPIHAPCRKVPPTVWPSLPSWPGVANLRAPQRGGSAPFNMHHATGLSIQPSEKAGAENAGGLFSRMAAAVERTTDRRLALLLERRPLRPRGVAAAARRLPALPGPAQPPGGHHRHRAPAPVSRISSSTVSSRPTPRSSPGCSFVGRLTGTRLAAKLFVVTVLALGAIAYPRFVLSFGGRRRMALSAFFAWPMVHDWFVSTGMLDFALAVPLATLLLVALNAQRQHATVARGAVIGGARRRHLVRARLPAPRRAPARRPARRPATRVARALASGARPRFCRSCRPRCSSARRSGLTRPSPSGP